MNALKTIAHIQSDFPSKFGIPRQSNMVQNLKASIVFEPDYRNPDAVRGLEDFSHIWLIWGFSETKKEKWSPTVRPPRLGGNRRIGVFATRSPYRPNPLGLSCVQIEKIERHPHLGPVIHVLGADLMSGTPIYDIKPYLPFADCHTSAVGGFADEAPRPLLKVIIPEMLLENVPHELRHSMQEILSFDPRPPYQNDPDRMYGMPFAGFEIKFSVYESILTVHEIEKL